MKENIQAYVILIQKGKLTLDEVPQEFRDEVAKQLEVGE